MTPLYLQVSTVDSKSYLVGPLLGNKITKHRLQVDLAAVGDETGDPVLEIWMGWPFMNSEIHECEIIDQEVAQELESEGSILLKREDYKYSPGFRTAENWRKEVQERAERARLRKENGQSPPTAPF